MWEWEWEWYVILQVVCDLADYVQYIYILYIYVPCSMQASLVCFSVECCFEACELRLIESKRTNLN